MQKKEQSGEVKKEKSIRRKSNQSKNARNNS